MSASSSADRAPTQTLQIPRRLDRGAALSLAAELQARRGAPISLKGTEVEQLGAFGLQSLLVAQRSWEMDGVPFRILGASDAMKADLATMGVQPDLLAMEEEA